jgi:hypothetical protein
MARFGLDTLFEALRGIGQDVKQSSQRPVA